MEENLIAWEYTNKKSTTNFQWLIFFIVELCANIKCIGFFYIKLSSG